MLYPVEIQNPFKDRYGSKIRFRLSQKIEIVKSVTIKILNHQELINNLAALPVEIKFDLFKLSLLLNNGNDEVIADAPSQTSMFQVNSDWANVTYLSKNEIYDKQKLILNKKLIKNSVHYAVFKMTDDLINYIAINTYTQAFGDYLRSDDFKLMLYVESA